MKLKYIFSESEYTQDRDSNRKLPEYGVECYCYVNPPDFVPCSLLDIRVHTEMRSATRFSPVPLPVESCSSVLKQQKRN